MKRWHIHRSYNTLGKPVDDYIDCGTNINLSFVQLASFKHLYPKMMGEVEECNCKFRVAE